MALNISRRFVETRTGKHKRRNTGSATGEKTPRRKVLKEDYINPVEQQGGATLLDLGPSPQGIGGGLALGGAPQGLGPGPMLAPGLMGGSGLPGGGCLAGSPMAGSPMAGNSLGGATINAGGPTVHAGVGLTGGPSALAGSAAPSAGLVYDSSPSTATPASSPQELDPHGWGNGGLFEWDGAALAGSDLEGAGTGASLSNFLYF
ncbi:hypothetical protein GNI_098350 [Gregarina niphandrodes]|uniref:Uncharacterized protein n=1 Tax=Gregarina niphandrodes TaxID=110365 RepID=A0A023B4R3_GRENI|nr:hypothetical protein GNI_098350 [Gregarina niphandrodes]EZG57277.1 hypothetical protein GNI_098350 [Gregarina niphandrodes]|eukprot:XP_011131061.1 hypothetical protein GNI_098350 [Gregarina niphandrodes]